VQIGEQHHVIPQKAKFFWLWLLHLHDQVRPPGLFLIHDQCACSGEGLVINSCSGARTALDPHL
jgi:hypothetical protein